LGIGCANRGSSIITAKEEEKRSETKSVYSQPLENIIKSKKYQKNEHFSTEIICFAHPCGVVNFSLSTGCNENSSSITYP
jgi:hypothetical protein